MLIGGVLIAGRLDRVPYDFPGGRWIGNVVLLIGLLVGLWAAWALRRGLTPFPEPVSGSALVESGPYRLVRHPMYTAVLLVMLGLALGYQDWLATGLALVLVPFFWLKSTHEERRLDAHFPGYAGYRARVRFRLIPGVI